MCNGFTVLQRVVDELSVDSEVFYDIHCSDPFEAGKEYVFPMVILNHFGAYPFVLIENKKDYDFELFETLEYILSVFKSYFCIRQKIDCLFVLVRKDVSADFECKRNFSNQEFANVTDSSFDVYLYQTGYKELMYDKNEVFKNVVVQEIVDMVSRESDAVPVDKQIDDEEYDDLFLRFSKESSEALESDLTPENCFVKKNGQWVPAFTQDPEKVFNFALFGGFLGLHRFYLRMFGTGVLYFFTLGVFGIGWFFDCLEILLGHWRKNGKVLMPIEEKKSCAIKMLFVFGVLAAVVVLLWSTI